LMPVGRVDGCVAMRCAALGKHLDCDWRQVGSKQGQGVGIFARLGSCQVDPRPFLDLKCRYGNAFNFPPIKSPILPLSPNQRNASPANKLTADRRIFPNPANKRWVTWVTCVTRFLLISVISPKLAKDPCRQVALLSDLAKRSDLSDDPRHLAAAGKFQMTAIACRE